jgi:hypothetical protein
MDKSGQKTSRRGVGKNEFTGDRKLEITKNVGKLYGPTCKKLSEGINKPFETKKSFTPVNPLGRVSQGKMNFEELDPGIMNDTDAYLNLSNTNDNGRNDYHTLLKTKATKEKKMGRMVKAIKELGENNTAITDELEKEEVDENNKEQTKDDKYYRNVTTEYIDDIFANVEKNIHREKELTYVVGAQVKTVNSAINGSCYDGESVISIYDQNKQYYDSVSKYLNKPKNTSVNNIEQKEDDVSVIHQNIDYKEEDNEDDKEYPDIKLKKKDNQDDKKEKPAAQLKKEDDDLFEEVVILDKEDYIDVINNVNNDTIIIEPGIKQPNIFKRMWDNTYGRTSIIITGCSVVLVCAWAITAGIAMARTGVSRNEKVRILPFNNVSKLAPTDLYYNKDVDDKLKFILATVAIELRDKCTDGNSISWGDMQSILAQCPAVQKNPKEKEINETGTFVGEFSDTNVKTWLYKFLKENDTDVFDVARIHDNEIKEVIDFIQNCSTHHFWADDVFNSYDLLDIGMMRFPTKTEPYVKIYRLQLTGLFSGSSFMTASRNITRSISASVYSCKYLPRDDLLERLSPDMIKSTLVKFEHMLTD